MVLRFLIAVLSTAVVAFHPTSRRSPLHRRHRSLAMAQQHPAVQSLRNLVGGDDGNACTIDWAALDAFVTDKAALNYKDWALTSAWAEELEAILGNPETSADFRLIFDRVLSDGNWPAAASHAAATSVTSPPWIVLVTGLNGIRKTTAMSQPWFRAVLYEALGDAAASIPPHALPTGDNSFFRQLDYMVATLANEDFRALYGRAGEGITTDDYSADKDGIFKKYRTLAEILGVLLLRAAQRGRLNALVETSGRDIASFDYIDTVFAGHAPPYRKLVIHFSIDDITYAERSVDVRMAGEMKAGSAAASAAFPSAQARAQAVVAVNAGGPYGSAVLRGVQADSDKVWATVAADTDGPRKDWLKASIRIRGSDDPAAWTARAVLPDGSESAKEYVFERRK